MYQFGVHCITTFILYFEITLLQLPLLSFVDPALDIKILLPLWSYRITNFFPLYLFFYSKFYFIFECQPLFGNHHYFHFIVIINNNNMYPRHQQRYTRQTHPHYNSSNIILTFRILHDNTPYQQLYTHSNSNTLYYTSPMYCMDSVFYYNCRRFRVVTYSNSPPLGLGFIIRYIPNFLICY